jgi:outer membrane protein insertion porin family
LEKIILIILFMTSLNGVAFAMFETDFTCQPKANCDFTKNIEIERLFKNRKFKSIQSAEEYFESIISHRAVQSFNYTIINEKIKGNFTLKKIIKKVNLDTNIPTYLFVENKIFGEDLPFYFGPGDIEKTIKKINDDLIRQGYLNAQVSFNQPLNEEILYVKIQSNQILRIKEVKITGLSSSFEKALFREAIKMKGEIYNQDNWRNARELVMANFANAGYFGTDLIENVSVEGTNVSIELTLKNASRLFYQIAGNHSISFAEIKNEINTAIRLKSVANDETIKNAIETIYRQKAFLEVNVVVTSQKGMTLNGDKGIYYFAQINEGRRSYIDSIEYEGATPEVEAIIKKLFKQKKSSLADGGFYDKDFYVSFVSDIKNELTRFGYLNASISEPNLRRSTQSHYNISYNIVSGQQIKIRSVSVKTDTKNEEIKNEILGFFTDFVDRPINLNDIEEQMEKIEDLLDSKGFIFSKIRSKKINEIFFRTEDDRYLDCILVIDLKERAIFDTVQINGLNKTKAVVVEREINIKRGEVITNKVLKEINERILNLGLFSYVRVAPLIKDVSQAEGAKWTDIVLQFKERDYGVVSVAPGYRTDLGYKLKTAVTLNNIDGMNKSLSLSAQANRRTSLSNLDDRRRQNGKQFFEYQGTALYSIPRFWGSLFKLDTTAQFNRTRFFSFDADILKLSLNAVTDLGRYWTFAIQYQLENIVQSDASSATNSGFFRIGGLTPSLTFDIRDAYVNPKKGFSSSLSVEHAAPYFYSMSKEDKEINFIKSILRNRAYLTFGGITFATYLSGGAEKNLQQDKVVNNGVEKVDEFGNPISRGYIPSIKVFRLDGLDVVRGFRDNEINALDNGEDITRRPVTNMAYFMIFKFEPRMQIAENVLWNIFYDAGRVFVNSFEINELRTSYGTGIKFLTPVGTIDFDYGIKTQRKRLSGNSIESFGRFHLSIGVF